MNIVFLAVNSSYSHSALAAWCLKAALPEGSAGWRTIEVTVKDDPLAVEEAIQAARPDVLAATLYLFNRAFLDPLLSRVRARLPDCLILVGGPECLGDNRHLVTPIGAADAAIRGEGEIALRELLRCRQAGQDWSGIPGVCRHLATGEYRDNGFADQLAELDALKPFYGSELAGFRKPFVQLETSRGCHNGCLFCTSRQTRLRVHSLERVRADLAEIRKAGVREVRLVDRTFNEDRGRAVTLVRLFREEFAEMRFHLEVDPARFGEGLAREFAMAEPGQFHIEAGVQSLSPDVYVQIQRQATVERTLEGLTRLCGLGNTRIHVDLIAGLPGGTLAGLLADLEKVIGLAPAEIQLERLKLLPGTPLAATPAHWGLEASAEPPYGVLSTPSMGDRDLALADRLSRLLDCFYNAPALHEWVVDAVRARPEFLMELEQRFRERAGSGGRPDLEDRFLVLDSLVGGELRQRVRYRWYRLGFSTRMGPSPASVWRRAIPAGATLVEGDPAARVARVVRVELERPYFFCYGTAPEGGRAVVAVYRM